MTTARPYGIQARYRRTVSSIPELKSLVPVASEADEPIPFGSELGDLCSDVIFYELKDIAGNKLWSKKWLGQRRLLEPWTRSIERFLASLERTDLCLAKDHSHTFGLIYDFDETLFSSANVVHYWNRWAYFTADECRLIEQTGDLIIRVSGLPRVPLSQLTDFQIVRSGPRLVYLDFELWPSLVP